MDLTRRNRALPSLLAAGAVALLGAGVITVATHAGDAAPTGASPSHAAHSPAAHGGHGTAGRSVTDLTGPRDAEPDVRVTLTARHAPVTLPSGTVVDALTFDGTAPGPELRLRVGELVEVTLHNLDVDEGVTLHWHGLDVPTAEDGVAGVTQDAVAPGGSHVYRFRPEQAGTFWYHSHQDPAATVPRGLFGALVVEAPDAPTDAVLLGHTWPGADTVIGGPAGPDLPARVRLVNTDSSTQTWTVAGAAFTVVAIDGFDVAGPIPLHGAALRIPAGGRIDVRLAGPATVGIVDGPSVGLGTDPQQLTQAGPAVDPLSYGTPAAPETGPFDRELVQVLDTDRVVHRGVPSVVWTINGSLDPEPATVVDGELVRITIRNDGTDPHPMHLHGHHVRVLSRDGVPATGSAWWTDSLGVEPGETYEVAFRAANPGVWMDHCHNLTHAAAGMVLHLVYEGVSTPFRHGGGAEKHLRMIAAAPLSWENTVPRLNRTPRPGETMNPRRPLAAALAAALLSVTTACGGGATPAAPAGPATPAASADTACTNLLAIDTTPSPDGGPEGPAPAAAVQEWATALVPLLDGALAAAPPELATSLTALQPYVRAAATEGTEPDFEDPAFTGAITGYETWAHDNCGYQNIDLVGTDFRFDGAPTELAAGPVSMLLTNQSAAGEFHVALLARAKDPATTVEQFAATPFEGLMEVVDLVPGGAAAAPGQTSGTLADLEPGKYFLLCPVGDEGELPHHLQGMITEITVA